MNQNQESQYLVGVSIDPMAADHDDELLQGIALAFSMHAGPSETEKSTDLMSVRLFRQSNEPGHHTIGLADVFSMSTEMLENGIHKYEHGQVFELFEDKEPGLVFMFALGDVAFCQAFVHFVATGKEGSAQNWGMHYIRKLSDAGPGGTFWYDTETPDEYFFDQMSDMIQSFEKQFAA